MRNFVIAAGIFDIAAVLASFAPISWSNVERVHAALVSVSPAEMTLAANSLPLAAPAHAH